MNTSKILRFTNQVIFTEDDVEAKTIIMALGMLDKISPNATLPPESTKTGRAKNIAIEFHGTHWLMIGCAEGYKDKEDNGYTVVGWPKDQTSREEFIENIAKLNSQLYAGVEDEVQLEFIKTKTGEKN